VARGLARVTAIALLAGAADARADLPTRAEGALQGPPRPVAPAIDPAPPSGAGSPGGSPRAPDEPGGEEIGSGTPAAPDGALAPADLETLALLHEGHLREIEHGKLAEERATSSKVRAYARRMATDHAAANRRLVAFLRKHDVAVEALRPPAPTGADLGGSERIHGVAGAAFDEVFAQAMADEHAETLAKLRAAREATADAELRALLEGFEALVARHKRLAQALAR
jgi:putative membrane protein